MNIVEITKNLIDIPYELGKMDCMHMIYDFLSQEMKMPIEFKDITLNNYKDLFERDPNTARNLMIEFLESLLTEVHLSQMRSGDVVVLRYCYQSAFLGIVIGNGQVLICTIEGVTSISLHHYRIERVFRCPE